MTVTIPPRAVLVDGVRAAIAAPSLHNSQPWLFRLRRTGVEVYADPGRRLRVLDPAGREQLISVGAAIFNLRLALRQTGFGAVPEIFPDPADPDLVARITVRHAARVTPAVETLAAAIPYRRTNRWPFARTPVPPTAVRHLKEVAHREGAVLALASPTGRDSLLGLARSADRWLRARPGYRAELARWSGRSARVDGVPPLAAGAVDALEILPVRDFAELDPRRRRREEFEPAPTVLVLATRGDGRADWVRAGQALQRVLLTATWQGLATTPISQPVEVPGIRRMLTNPATGLFAQMMLRVGYGREAAMTPRRPVSDVLDAALAVR